MPNERQPVAFRVTTNWRQLAQIDAGTNCSLPTSTSIDVNYKEPSEIDLNLHYLTNAVCCVNTCLRFNFRIRKFMKWRLFLEAPVDS